MKTLRRDFIKKSALAGAGAVLTANELLSAPLILQIEGLNPLQKKEN
jgi:hypothetical protein